MIMGTTVCAMESSSGPFDVSSASEQEVLDLSFFNELDLAQPIQFQEDSWQTWDDRGHLEKSLFDYCTPSIKQKIFELTDLEKGEEKLLNTAGLVLVAKLEYAKQQGHDVDVCLSDQWRAVFSELPDPFFSHYQDIALPYPGFIVDLPEILGIIKFSTGTIKNGLCSLF